MALYGVAESVRVTPWALGVVGDGAASLTEATTSCTIALVLSALCLAGTQLSLLCGWTLMLDRLSFLHLACGFWGGLLTTWYLLAGWRWQSAWWLFGLFALPPALCEAAALLAMFRFDLLR